jgi:hypothetical protein
VTADEVSSRVVERYDGVILTLKCIPSRFGDEAT